jgi:hypothetical protein
VRRGSLAAVTSQIETFAEVVREYVTWAERTSPPPPSEDAVEVLGILARLYSAALTLPQTEGAADERERTSVEEWRKIYSRCGNLPLEVYWQVLDPLAESPGDIACGSLGDDLADIHRDLKVGLSYFDEGAHEAAAWEWKFHFHAHWGSHAAGAIYALNSWYANY